MAVIVVVDGYVCRSHEQQVNYKDEQSYDVQSHVGAAVFVTVSDLDR